MKKTSDKYYTLAERTFTAFKILCISACAAAVAMGIYTIVSVTTSFTDNKNSLIGYIVFMSVVIALILSMFACYVAATLYNKKCRAALKEELEKGENDSAENSEPEENESVQTENAPEESGLAESDKEE